MFDYFRNYLSNGHQVCCEDSPTKGPYDHHCQSANLDLIQGHKCVSNLTTFQLAISQTIFELTFKLGMREYLSMPYMLMFVLMTLTLMQGHSGSAKEKISVV